MKKILYLILIIILFPNYVKAECTKDTLYDCNGFPDIYKDKDYISSLSSLDQNYDYKSINDCDIVFYDSRSSSAVKHHFYELDKNNGKTIKYIMIDGVTFCGVDRDIGNGKWNYELANYNDVCQEEDYTPFQVNFVVNNKEYYNGFVCRKYNPPLTEPSTPPSDTPSDTPPPIDELPTTLDSTKYDYTNVINCSGFERTFGDYKFCFYHSSNMVKINYFCPADYESFYMNVNDEIVTGCRKEKNPKKMPLTECVDSNNCCFYSLSNSNLEKIDGDLYVEVSYINGTKHLKTYFYSDYYGEYKTYGRETDVGIGEAQLNVGIDGYNAHNYIFFLRANEIGNVFKINDNDKIECPANLYLNNVATDGSQYCITTSPNGGCEYAPPGSEPTNPDSSLPTSPDITPQDCHSLFGDVTEKGLQHII